MAWYEDSLLDANAGTFLDYLDAYLPLNSHWEIYDSDLGSGSADDYRVYRCYDYAENCDFFLFVDNATGGEARIELWEAWDISTHSGVGSSLTSFGAYSIYVGAMAGQVKLALHDHHLVYISPYWDGYYIGQPTRVDTSNNLVLACGHGGTNWTALQNPLAYSASASSADMRCLFDESGGGSYVDRANCLTQYTRQRQRIGGTFTVNEDRVCNRTTELVIGWLAGCCSLGSTSSSLGLGRGDQVTVDGVDWICCDGSYTSTRYQSLVRMA